MTDAGLGHTYGCHKKRLIVTIKKSLNISTLRHMGSNDQMPINPDYKQKIALNQHKGILHGQFLKGIFG